MTRAAARTTQDRASLTDKRFITEPLAKLLNEPHL